MKPPAWMRVEEKGLSADGRSIEVVIHILRWHPGFWLFVARGMLGDALRWIDRVLLLAAMLVLLYAIAAFVSAAR
jgi:hypothetical protein